VLRYAPSQHCTSISVSARRGSIQSKVREWSTPNRVYCPVPTCSAFIPSRLIPTTTPQISTLVTLLEGWDEYPRMSGEQSHLAQASRCKFTLHHQHRHQLPALQSPCPPTMSCPKCIAQICASCKLLQHPEHLALQATWTLHSQSFTKWKIKRCPKCRAAVKRMFGCSHPLPVRCAVVLVLPGAYRHVSR
jgi:hypothetical protein